MADAAPAPETPRRRWLALQASIRMALFRIRNGHSGEAPYAPWTGEEIATARARAARLLADMRRAEDGMGAADIAFIRGLRDWRAGGAFHVAEANGRFQARFGDADRSFGEGDETPFREFAERDAALAMECRGREDAILLELAAAMGAADLPTLHPIPAAGR